MGAFALACTSKPPAPFIAYDDHTRSATGNCRRHHRLPYSPPSSSRWGSRPCARDSRYNDNSRSVSPTVNATSVVLSMLGFTVLYGVLAVIDFPPPYFFGRGSFGVPAKTVVSEVTGSGFELLRRFGDWPGRGPLGSYCVVFRKP